MTPTKEDVQLFLEYAQICDDLDHKDRAFYQFCEGRDLSELYDEDGNEKPGNIFERKAKAKAWLQDFDPDELEALRAEVQSLKSRNEKLQLENERWKDTFDVMKEQRRYDRG